MTREEFMRLKVGDRISWRGREDTITEIEKEFDYSTRPAGQKNWQVHTKTGYSLQMHDAFFAEVRVKES